MPDDRRILVTGGAGFLGSHLCEYLLKHGNEVLCVDNFYTGSKRNIHHLLDDHNFELLRHDVCSPLYVEVDQIFNLACPASPIHYQRDPVQTTKTSVHGAINILGLAKRLKVPILQASTSEVYGDPEVHPQTESYWGRVNPIGVRSCYDEGKRCAETLFFNYRRQHQLATKVARIFNTYGPRMHPNDGRVVSNFIVQALTGPVNLGNPQEMSMANLAKIVKELTNSSSIIVFKALPGDDPRQRQPDISLASSALGWAPSVPLRDGLQRTVQYFDALL